MTTHAVGFEEAALELGAAQWDDLYMRHRFDDTGLYPNPGSDCLSPDIIPSGLVTYADPAQLITDGNWMTDFGSAGNGQEPNYVYVRGRNLGGIQTSGRVYMYAVQASMIMWPQTPAGSKQKGWAQQPIPTQQGDEYVTVDAGPAKRFVTMQPFEWIPDNITGDHYCLCSRLTTPAHPNPIPTVDDLNDWGKWISNHPNMAWHNITLKNSTDQVWTISSDYSQGDTAGDVWVQLLCENCPDGSDVAMNAVTPGTDPAFSIPRTTIQNTPHKGVPTFTRNLYVSIPANWVSNVTFTWWSNGKTPLPNMKISLFPLLPNAVGWDPALERFMRPIEDFGIERTDHVSPTLAMVIGGVQAKGTPPAPQASSGRHGVAGALAKSSFLIAGFAWEDKSSSVIDQTVVPHDVAIEHVDSKGVDTEVLRLTGRPKPAGLDIDADLTVDVALAGAPAGDTFFNLVSRSVPVGCEIWFKNQTGSIDISQPPTKVTQENQFSVSDLVTLTAGYEATLRMYLLLNGNVLPSDWSLQFAAIQPTVGAQADRSNRSAIGDGAPQPGKLLGSVTAKR